MTTENGAVSSIYEPGESFKINITARQVHSRSDMLTVPGVPIGVSISFSSSSHGENRIYFNGVPSVVSGRAIRAILANMPSVWLRCMLAISINSMPEWIVWDGLWYADLKVRETQREAT
jgi:hypothetical protein